MAGVVIMGKNPSGNFVDLNCDADGNLNCELTSSIDVAIGDVDMIANTQADGAGTKLHTVCDTDGHLQVDVLTGGGETKTFTYNQDPSETVVSGTPVDKQFVVVGGCDQVNTAFDEINPLKIDSSGHLTVNGITQAQGDATHPDTAYKQKVYVGLHDQGNNLIRTARCDANGDLVVVNSSINAGSDATLSTAQQVVAYGRDQSGNLDALNVDNNGHLKITVNDIESGIANALPVSSSQLPASLGQKANASSISICRSTTTGAFDLSARTTPTTASTSTKLLCSSTGALHIVNSTRTADTTYQSTTQNLSASGGQSSSFGVGTDTTYARYMINFGTTSPTSFFIMGSQDNSNWFMLKSVYATTVGSEYHASELIEKCPAYVCLQNNDSSAIDINWVLLVGRH